MKIGHRSKPLNSMLIRTGIYPASTVKLFNFAGIGETKCELNRPEINKYTPIFFDSVYLVSVGRSGHNG